MVQKYVRTVAAWIAAAVLFSTSANAVPVVSAKHAILIDGITGRTLWEQNADEQALIASTTKIMTGLLIAENCNLESEVRISREAVGIEGSSLYLKEGEILTVEALLYGLMLHSGNDAAVALAIFCSGSVDTFVDLMNLRASEIGLQNTHFANPHGLDSKDNYSSARDLSILTVCAMENPVFHQVVSSKRAEFGNRIFTNHNKLLWRYDDAVGVKTGYTKSAGRILVSCAERDGRRLIAVTISDPDDWDDHCKMLDYGFSFFEDRRLVHAGEIIAEIPVIGGAEATAEAVPAEDHHYPIAAEENVELFCQLPDFVYAPVLAGEPAGEVIVLVDGTEQMKIPLFWRYSVMEGS